MLFNLLKKTVMVGAKGFNDNVWVPRGYYDGRGCDNQNSMNYVSYSQLLTYFCRENTYM